MKLHVLQKSSSKCGKCAQLLYNKPLWTQESLQLMPYKTEGNPNTTFINCPSSTIFLFCLALLKWYGK